MQHAAIRQLAVVVMAKPATPGRVKTRLIESGGLTAVAAAAAHAAMMDCVLDRLTVWLPGARRVVALATDSEDSLPRELAPAPGGDSPASLEGWEVVGQGEGNLGRRLAHVWQALGGGAVAFFGVDSPDAPAGALRAIPELLDHGDAALGPTEDGGYWTLAARTLCTELVTGIDWGTPAVYDQTRAAAARAGIVLNELPRWHDVDTPHDLAALRARLEVSVEPPLVRLRNRLRVIVERTSPDE